MSLTIFNALLFFVCLPLAAAHAALWDASMFGRCGQNNQCGNSDDAAQPLQNYNFTKWWWHNNLAFPPPPDAVLQLPAGRNVTVEIACNVAFTHLGQYPNSFWPGGAPKGSKNESVEGNSSYWANENVGNLHTTGHSDLAGCSLSIAYTDDQHKVRPEDMVVISVQHECHWHRDTQFEIPAEMPPCPNGKCMCFWNWIHNSNAGTEQMNQTPFQCNITHNQGQQIFTKPLAKPVPPVNCEHNQTLCILGAKMPMYWKQLECNNMYETSGHAPTYNTRYGFSQGAQNDIFTPAKHPSNWTCPQSQAVGVFPRNTNQTVVVVPRAHKRAKPLSF